MQGVHLFKKLFIDAKESPNMRELLALAGGVATVISKTK
jgi:hypothetical protein